MTLSILDRSHITVNLFSSKHSDTCLPSRVFRHAQVIEDQAGVAIEFGHFLSDADFGIAEETQYTHRNTHSPTCGKASAKKPPLPAFESPYLQQALTETSGGERYNAVGIYCIKIQF
jgi:hypothetical protein